MFTILKPQRFNTLLKHQDSHTYFNTISFPNSFILASFSNYICVIRLPVVLVILAPPFAPLIKLKYSAAFFITLSHWLCQSTVLSPREPVRYILLTYFELSLRIINVILCNIIILNFISCKRIYIVSIS